MTKSTLTVLFLELKKQNLVLSLKIFSKTLKTLRLVYSKIKDKRKFVYNIFSHIFKDGSLASKTELGGLTFSTRISC